MATHEVPSIPEQVPTGAAARFLGISDTRLRQLVREGKVAAEETPLGFLFDRVELERVAGERAARAAEKAS